LKSSSSPHIFRNWVPALLWLAVIAVESFALSGNVTGVWLQDVLGLVHIHLSAAGFAELHHGLRKAGHVTGYGILCLLLFRAWFYTLPAGTINVAARRFRSGALALGLTLLTAILDEWHQSFDPTRTSSPLDVALDMCGAIAFLCIALFIFRAWRRVPSEDLEAVPV
jgi:VanZ family protein